MTHSFTPWSLKQTLDPFFTSNMTSEYSDTKGLSDATGRNQINMEDTKHRHITENGNAAKMKQYNILSSLVSSLFLLMKI